MNASAGKAPEIRARVYDGLGFPGGQLKENRNAAGEPLISADQGYVKVRVIRKGGDVIVAKAVFRMLADTQTSPAHLIRGATP
jgi:acetate kinase